MRLLHIAAITLALQVAIAFAQAPELEYKPLRGLRELRISVEQLHSSSTDAGLSTSQLRTEVETLLRRRGVVAVATPATGSESPYLYLRVTTRKASSDGYPYFIELMLRETVVPTRDNTITTIATTWYRMRGGYVSASGTTGLAHDIRDAVLDMTNRFADDYFRANPER